jgi:hypothetical protein
MAAIELTSKRVAISKANAQMIIFVAIACFITVFALVASNLILSQNSYQARLIDAKNATNKQLKANIQAFSALQSSYNSFISSPNNIIGGLSTGSGPNDGSNDKIVLDSLPSTYDYPSLAATLENILSSQGLQVSDISGTDEQLTQQGASTSATPTPIAMPISFTVEKANYQGVEQLISKLQLSIRPFAIDTINLSGSQNNITLEVTAHSYYQPAKTLSVQNKTIK